MRIMAIAAGDPHREHLALLERTVIIDLVEHLTVRMVEPARKGGDDVRVGQRVTRDPVLGKFAASRVAKTAGLDLPAQDGGRDTALWIAGFRIGKPGDAVTLVQEHSKTLCRIIALSEWPPALLVACPSDVTRSLPMAGLAADAYFCPDGTKAIIRCIVVFLHAGRMAFGTHEIPVLVQLAPMQDVVMLDLVVRIKMEPALAAGFLRPAVPGKRQRLQSPIGEFDEILLQGIEAERVLDLEHAELAVGPVGLNQEFSVFAKEARVHAVIVEACLVEIAQHRLLGHVLHGPLVLRAAPPVRLGPMAAGASLAADEGCDGSAGRLAGWPTAIQELESETDCNDDHCRSRCCDPDLAFR